MKNNARYTAFEIVQTILAENAEATFGTMLVNIGGIGGIVQGDRIIFISKGSKTLDVYIGYKLHTIELEDNTDEPFESEAVKAIREGKKEL